MKPMKMFHEQNAFLVSVSSVFRKYNGLAIIMARIQNDSDECKDMSKHGLTKSNTCHSTIIEKKWEG